MSDKTTIGDRMKAYEAVTRTKLVPRMPVMIRLDGKAFHTLTRHMQKPTDHLFEVCMDHAAHALCEEIQGCQLAYIQSDEITLLLVDYKTHETQAWFDNQLQKMVSVSASIATAAFGEMFRISFPDSKARPTFDSRAWNIPKEDVANNLLWRQQDATRNAIQSLGQAHFSPKELHGKSCNEIQDTLWQKCQINFDKLPTSFKRGRCVVRQAGLAPGVFQRGEDPCNEKPGQWYVDLNIPIFSQDRSYIERHVYPEAQCGISSSATPTPNPTT